MPPELITAADAALYTGRSVGTIWRWASEGRISRYGAGRNVRYSLDELPRATRDEWTGDVTLADPPPLPEGRTAA